MPLTIGLISDLHFGPEARFEGKLRKLTAQAAHLTRGFVREMNEHVRPDFVVNLGDDIEDAGHDADAANYAACMEILHELACPVVHVAGNHDIIHLKVAELLGFWKRSGKLYYSLEHGAFHLVVMHTVERAGIDVGLDAEQLRWLQQDLATGTSPVLVFMHHPASEQEIEDSRWFAKAPHVALVKNRAEFRQILERSGRVRAVFNGHTHRNHFDVIRGIPYVTLQSLIENLDDDAPGRAAGAFGVVRVSDTRLVVRVRGEDPARYQVEF